MVAEVVNLSYLVAEVVNLSHLVAFSVSWTANVHSLWTARVDCIFQIVLLRDCHKDAMAMRRSNRVLCLQLVLATIRNGNAIGCDGLFA